MKISRCMIVEHDLDLTGIVRSMAGQYSDCLSKLLMPKF